MQTKTYIDFVLLISKEEISKNSRLVQITEHDHVLDVTDGGRVHVFYLGLRVDEVFAPVIVDDANPTMIGGLHDSANGDGKLARRLGLQPHMVTLVTENVKS